DQQSCTMDAHSLENIEILIHLSGANIGSHRWTKTRKQQILDSRIHTANAMFNILQNRKHKVHTMISMSAVGFYGSSDTDEVFTEVSPPGNDFLAMVCSKWEDAAFQFTQLGVRTVIFRSGVVLASGGGALNKMAFPFRFGLGAPLGTGLQFLPWIHIDDLCQIFLKAVREIEMSGVYNAVAPEHINNREFSKILSQVLNRPFWLPHIPGFALKWLLGEMSQMVLDGSRVSAGKLQNTGFNFKYPTLQSALTEIYTKHEKNLGNTNEF
ncbi:MAG: TIGR01777 family oxidoreductase, partial [Fidelibacterota bacterium]